MFKSSYFEMKMNSIICKNGERASGMVQGRLECKSQAILILDDAFQSMTGHIWDSCPMIVQ